MKQTEAQAVSRQELVAAPVSRAMAKLLHQLQAQIIREADERASGTLANFATLRAPQRYDDADRIAYVGENGTDELVQRRFCPESWINSRVAWHPSHWRLYCRRTDTCGRSWSLDGGSLVHVMDDFGALVPVPEEMQ